MRLFDETSPVSYISADKRMGRVSFLQTILPWEMLANERRSFEKEFGSVMYSRNVQSCLSAYTGIYRRAGKEVMLMIADIKKKSDKTMRKRLLTIQSGIPSDANIYLRLIICGTEGSQLEMVISL